MSLTNLRTTSFARPYSEVGRDDPVSHQPNPLAAGVAGTSVRPPLDAPGRAPASRRRLAALTMPPWISLRRKISGNSIAARLVFAIGRATNVAVVLISGLLASTLCSGLPMALDQRRLFSGSAIAIATATALTFARVWQPEHPSNLRHRLGVVLVSLAAGWIIGIACCGVTLGSSTGSYQWDAVWGGLAAASALTLVSLTTPFMRFAESGLVAPRVAVVGINDYANGLIERLRNGSGCSAKFVGLYRSGSEPELGSHRGERVLGDIGDLVERTRVDRVDAIVLAYPVSDHENVGRLKASLGSVVSDVYLATDLLDLACRSSAADRIAGQPVIKIASRPLTEWQVVKKSVVDWILAAILLIAAFPMLGLVAIAIKIDSPGPVFFRQQRLGFNNILFEVFKFRTMFHHMADAHADRQTTRGDPRITRLGRFLRRTSIDEVPQLLNVLRGEMSLVGPRPHAANTKAGDHLFHEVVATYALRHRVKPGITGWAQVNGWRGETRTFEQLEQRVAHDLHYIENWSLLLDIKILMLTALRELNSKVAF